MLQLRHHGLRVTGIIAFSLIVGGILTVASDARQSGASAQRRLDSVGGRHALAGEVLVKLRRTLPPHERAQFETLIDADRNLPVGGSGVLRLHSRQFDASALLALLENHPDVLYAEPNYLISSDNTAPNDPLFGALWGLLNVGQNGTPGADIGAPLAWDVSTGSRANVVAVVDTGVDYTHSDLAANIWSAPFPFTVTIGGQQIRCDTGTHGFNAISRTCDPRDDNGHGTHVAGTIGGVGNNGKGVAGVNWTASMMASKFLDATGQGTVADSIDAIEFVIQAAAATGASVRVLSNSWSIVGFSQALLDEIDSVNAHNMLFVASAGNSGSNNDANAAYPSGYDLPNIVAVAATDNTDTLASFSNYGLTSVDLAAPGVNILSTLPGETYQYLSGTSMAAPHVAGAAALILSRCALTTAGLKSLLLATVDPVPLLTGRVATGGRLNVNNAIRACNPPPPPPPPPPDFVVSVSPSTASASAASGYTLSYAVT